MQSFADNGVFLAPLAWSISARTIGLLLTRTASCAITHQAKMLNASYLNRVALQFVRQPTSEFNVNISNCYCFFSKFLCVKTRSVICVVRLVHFLFIQSGIAFTYNYSRQFFGLTFKLIWHAFDTAKWESTWRSDEISENVWVRVLRESNDDLNWFSFSFCNNLWAIFITVRWGLSFIFDSFYIV